MSEKLEMPYSPELQCDVHSLKYSFAARKGKIYFPEGDCCDMLGCIALFSRIDPSVTEIRTFSGNQDDTIYRKLASDWKAYDPPDGH